MRNQSGHVLLLMLALLTMASIYLVLERIEPFARRYARDEATMQTLALAKEALIGYAVTYRDGEGHGDEVFGYLPCPDSSDKAGLFHPGDGSAAGNCGRAGEAAIGLLPYKTLQLPDLRDADGNCLWYAVSGSHKNNPKGSAADTPILLNWDARGQFQVRDSSGNPLVAPDDAQGGAVVVIIAPGAALSGQPRSVSDYPCSADPSEYASYIEGIHAFPNNGATFVQGRHGSAVNNDALLWITAKEIFERIRQRRDFRNPSDSIPVGQINRFVDETRAVMESRIQDDLLNHNGVPVASVPTALHPPATPVPYAGYYQQFPGKLIGEPPVITALFDANYTRYLDNWRDHLRYAVCANLTSGCLTVAGQAGCRGVLLFGGERAGGGLRTAAEEVPSALAAPPPPPLGAYLANYFEADHGSGGLDMLTSASTTFSGATEYADSNRSADVGKCLFPGSFTTFKNDMGSFSVVTDPENPAAFIDPGARTADLGNLAAADNAGCVWTAGRLTLDTNLRAYFKFNIAQRGEGFVFAIVDANPALNSSPPGCGASGSALGYANGALNALNPPKLGLEIDTRQSSVRNDPSADHFAFVYWGGAASGGDDNTHGAGTLNSGSQPYNPRSLTNDKGIASVKKSDAFLSYDGILPVNTDIHVRLDLNRRHSAAANQSDYQLHAYVVDRFGDCRLADFQNLAADLSDLCKLAAKISDTFVIDDSAALGPALQSVHVGFSGGQSAATTQRISIADFMLRSY